MNRRVGMVEVDEIYPGDSLELLRQLPDDSIDLIFADPPYNLQLDGELYRPDRSMVEAVHDEWDKFDSFAFYDKFTGRWMEECRRVLKPTGCIWVIGTYHNIFRVGTILQNTGFWILNDIIWIKTNPMPNFMGTRFGNAHETLVWAIKSKEARYTFHYRTLKSFNDDLQMRSDWSIPICHGEERLRVEGKKAHSTQKPEELLYRILLATSNPGDLVLDLFTGSGTTTAVAKRLGRHFIGFERNPSYVKMARERVESIIRLQEPLLQNMTERRGLRVPFGNLLARGYINAGERLFTKDGRYSAEVQANATLICNGKTGSIHSICTHLTKRGSTNGWTFWHVTRDGGPVSIDDLREDYIRKYLK